MAYDVNVDLLFGIILIAHFILAVALLYDDSCANINYH